LLKRLKQLATIFSFNFYLFFGTGNGRGYAIVLFLGGFLLLVVYGINYKNQNLIKLQKQVEDSIKNAKDEID